MSDSSENNTSNDSGSGAGSSSDFGTAAVEKRCWFFHLGRCRNAVCKFVHDEYLLTPEGAEAVRLQTQARQRVIKALRRANSKLADEPLAIEKELQTAPEPEPQPTPKPRSKRVWQRRLSLCPYETEQRCQRPQCRLLHASKLYYYRVAVTQ
jgi:hypothetical protein